MRDDGAGAIGFSIRSSVESAEAAPEGEETSLSLDSLFSRHTWHALDLLALGAQPPEPPGIAGLFYGGLRHVVSGEAEAAKSWLLLAIAADELRADRGVLWVDDDNMGAAAVLERLRSLGLEDGRISTLFAYLRPAEPLSEAAIEDVKRLLHDRDGRLVVFDAFNASLTLHGKDPSSSRDVEQFFREVADPFCAEGAAVVLPDHVVKKANERGKYAYGAERKQTGADVHLGLAVLEPFGRGRTGKARLTVHKDRPGFLERPSPGLFVLASDPESGRCSWRIDADQGVGDGGNPALMEKVSRHLETASKPLSRNQIERAKLGKAEYVRIAIAALIAEGFATELKGPHGARLVKLLMCFREEVERGGS